MDADGISRANFCGLLDVFFQKKPDQQAERRERGRPTVWTPELNQKLQEHHAEAVAIFTQRHGRPPLSEKELIAAICAEYMQLHDLQESRAMAVKLKSISKTLRNRLSKIKTQ